MRFVIVDREDRIPAGPRPVAVLVRDGWDDFGFRSMFHLKIIQEGARHEIGVVKIGDLGTGRREESAVQLPDEFTMLGEDFFSVGQADTCYERLRQAGDHIRRSVLAALRDMASDEDVFEVARNEEVTRTSLWRFEKPNMVEEQFRRIARGGNWIRAFTIAYQARLRPGKGRAGCACRSRWIPTR
ncbi:hypothetical protein OG357_34780 [Streptomyces sp. NBC_01255]|uniref:hypothetical protein n=1 Tax=Streptomyces sp. NBC_01255 TaxID=2903798 RepID=UPI002E3487D9|nr:hypothetical protein [Streptomyces sp. NBC_01255]